MKSTKTLWLTGLALLVSASGAVYLYTVNFIKWNVPLYGVGMALLFLLGAAGFALAVFASGVAGTYFSGFHIPDRYSTKTLKMAAAQELSAAEGKLYGIDALSKIGRY